MQNKRFTNPLQIVNTVHLIEMLGKKKSKALTITILANKKLKITITGRFAYGKTMYLGPNSKLAGGKNTC